MKYQIHVWVIGKVTGVFFRAYTKDEAERGELTGWVRNVYDQPKIFGASPGVEAVFQGEKEAIEHALEWLKKGSPQAHVKQVMVEWEEATEQFHSFEIR